MNINLLILFKVVQINNCSFGEIHDITQKYCEKVKLSKQNFEYFFIVEKPDIDSILKVDGKYIYVKTNSDNYLSLLTKVAVSLKYFYTSSFTHIMISNVSTFINVDKIMKQITDHDTCIGRLIDYRFKGIKYKFISGAGYIMPINATRKLCDFLDTENFIDKNNKVSKYFIKKYTSKNGKNILTDDIFIGYFLHLNNIYSKSNVYIELCDKNVVLENVPLTHEYYRVKTLDRETDINCFKYLYSKIYDQC